MTDRVNKDKPSRGTSLSRGKKKGGVNSGRTGGPASITTPITSFFNSQPPPKLACPLCGQLVPRFKINEHIDVECQNFERSDGSAPSASSGVELSPTRSPLKSPTSGSNIKKGEAKTSPYFKKSSTQQAPREVCNKNVVRTIDLGRLSAKLSRKSGTATSERRQTGGKPSLTEKEINSEMISSSQKENKLIEGLEDKGGISRIDNLSMNTANLPNAVVDVSDPEANLRLDNKAKSDPMESIPEANSSSFKLSKRKKEASTGRRLSFSKRAKHEDEEVEEGGSAVMEETSPCERIEADTDQMKPEVPSCPAVMSSGESATEDKSTSLAEVGAGDQVVDGTQLPHLPYYLRNFRTVLQAVLENEDDRRLFDQQDMSHVHAFERLSVKGQKLYVRLFQRKLKWLQVNKVDYEEIDSDLGPVAQELVQAGFLQSESDLQDLAEALDLLPAPELKALAKTFHLGNSGTQKQQLVDGLLRLSRQKSLFSMTSALNNVGAVILKRAKQLAGSCVRLSQGPRAVFARILLLFSLTDTMDEEEMAAAGQSQLFTILLVNSGRLAFPDYTVQRKAKVFQDRDDLIRYENSMRTLLDVTLAMQGGHWEEAMGLYSAGKSCWLELRKSHDLRHQEELPVFLRSFTTGWAYTRILSRGVEILQRLRRYEEAVEELRSLLSQSVYCPDSRGRWWDRLALNLHQHLKKPEQAICAIRDGLTDPLVRTGHKLSLYQRAARMKESPSFKKYRLQLRELPAMGVQDVKHVTIRGQLFPHEGGMGKSRFLIPVSEEGANATGIGSVEELCLAHYHQQGFDQGIHGEGSTFSTLFALLLWDIVFMEGIPDVFRNPYQSCPLDLHTDHFYLNRKEAIEARVQMLNEAPVETLHDMMEEVWSSQEGKVCSLVSWERFTSLQQAQSLVSCLGGAFLAGMIARMSKDYRHCRAGLPDLVVWSTSNNSYKIVEVKGPSDRLSQKQQIWLDELHKLGADVEVCHVVATGARGASLE